MATHLDNIRRAYSELDRRVQVALRTQVGDAIRLNQVRSEALSLRAAAIEVCSFRRFLPVHPKPCQHAHSIPAVEFRILQASVERMVADLDAACHASADPPDAPRLPVIQTVPTGRRGRPPKIIDRTFLQYALAMRGPTHVARVLQCSPRTVRREALRLGLAEPGPPVFTRVARADGTVTQIHTTVTHAVSSLSDADLDQAVADILAVFPDFGRSMIAGHLAAHGHRVPDARIRLSYVRVRGAPAAFGRRRIIRKKYQVPGPNSLIHHDGQHGMSRSSASRRC